MLGDYRIHVHGRIPTHLREYVVVQVAEYRPVVLALEERAEDVRLQLLEEPSNRMRRHLRYAAKARRVPAVGVSPHPHLPSAKLVVPRLHLVHFTLALDRIALRPRPALGDHHLHVVRNSDLRHVPVLAVRHHRHLARHTLRLESVRELCDVRPQQTGSPAYLVGRRFVVRLALLAGALNHPVLRHHIHDFAPLAVRAPPETALCVPGPRIVDRYLAHGRRLAGEIALDVKVYLIPYRRGMADLPRMPRICDLRRIVAATIGQKREILGMALGETLDEAEFVLSVAAWRVLRLHAKPPPVARLQRMAQLVRVLALEPSALVVDRIAANRKIRSLHKVGLGHHYPRTARHNRAEFTREVEPHADETLQKLVHTEACRALEVLQPDAAASKSLVRIRRHIVHAGHEHLAADRPYSERVALQSVRGHACSVGPFVRAEHQRRFSRRRRVHHRHLRAQRFAEERLSLLGRDLQHAACVGRDHDLAFSGLEHNRLTRIAC